MIDFETLGTGANAMVVSLGACIFNKDKGVHLKNEWTFDLKHQQGNRSTCVDVISWWMKQSPAARKVFNLPGETLTLKEWFSDFVTWLAINEIDPKQLIIWSNGGDFDIPIYCDIVSQLGEKDPIPFWNHRCFRTADAIFKLKEKHKRQGTFHNALDDSVYQAECLINLWQGAKK